MKKLCISLSVSVAAMILMVSVSHAQSSTSISFGYKSSTISPGARTKIEQLALDLKHLKNITLTSCVPSVGDVSENQLFANQRVEAVKSELVNQGVPSSTISTQTIPCNKQRSVQISYGAGAISSSPPPSTSPQPAPLAPPPPAPSSTASSATPPPPAPQPSSEPVITAKPEKSYESGLKETDVSKEAYTGDEGGDTPPSRWEY